MFHSFWPILGQSSVLPCTRNKLYALGDWRQEGEHRGRSLKMSRLSALMQCFPNLHDHINNVYHNQWYLSPFRDRLSAAAVPSILFHPSGAYQIMKLDLLWTYLERTGKSHGIYPSLFFEQRDWNEKLRFYSPGLERVWWGRGRICLCPIDKKVVHSSENWHPMREHTKVNAFRFALPWRSINHID